MKTVNISGIDIDIHDGANAISHSGGADSGILLYILMKYSNGPLHVYTCASKQKNRVAPHVALNVISKCMDLTNKNDVYHHTYYTNIQTFDTLMIPLIEVVNINLYNINYLYTGVTKLPPDTEKKYFTNPMPLVNKRDSNIIRPLYNIKNKKIYSPFFNIDKKHIQKLYKDLNVIDSLFPLTRSCEDLMLTEGHCGKCWWCEERKWAFGKL